MAAVAFRLLWPLLSFSITDGVLDSQYLPAFNSGNTDTENLIEQYFRLGFTKREFLACLLMLHGIQPASTISVMRWDHWIGSPDRIIGSNHWIGSSNWILEKK